MSGEKKDQNHNIKIEKQLYLGECLNSLDKEVEYTTELQVVKCEKTEILGFSFTGITVLSDEFFENIREKESLIKKCI
ncbi:MAG: hypothetical protein ACLU05_01740 [Anaerococcus obesiensis]